jgi:ABC-type antimicrobial peptide transport system permease subunit
MRDGIYVDFGREASRFTFLSVHQRYEARQTLHLRHRPGIEPGALIASVRDVVAAQDPDVAVSRAMPLSSAMGSLLFPQRFAAALIGAFGLLGLFLAATGVYGVLSHHVVQRTREFGIRIALGAESGTLLGRVLRRGAILAGIGAVVGLVLAAALTRLLVDLLHGISPWDPVAFVAVLLLLGVVALLASLLPARRVLGMDPVEALRR